MINRKKNIRTYTQGFTLVETLIAILVLMVAIAGPYTIAAKGLQATLIAKDQDTAFNLAQEGVEYVRFVRDTNRLSSGNWLTGAGGGANALNLTACESAAGCRVNPLVNLQSSIVDCTTDLNGVCEPIQYNSANGYYSYTSGTASIFTRTIKIVTPVGSNSSEASVTVTVSWNDQGNIARQVTVREDLFNWE
jgi:Tfp pilus assembly protein PilV